MNLIYLVVGVPFWIFCAWLGAWLYQELHKEQ